MRYPRLSPDAKLTIGVMPSAVVCTGDGWDNLTVSKRKRASRNRRSKSASKRIKDQVNNEPSGSLLAALDKARQAWNDAEPGKDKQAALKVVVRLEMRAGIRDRAGKTVTLDYMPETWASGQN